MKICVTSEGKSLDSNVDLRFGRCQYFIIADIDSLEFEVLENPNIDTMGGAGIQSAQLVASKQVTAVLTGNVGPNAFQTLQAAGVEVFIGASGTIKEAIERYKKGEFQSVKSANVGSKFGMPGKSN
jgi:predicted Fe-Mo cluster-binding NifX family protein